MKKFMKQFIFLALAWMPFWVTMWLLTHWTSLDWRWWVLSASSGVTAGLLQAAKKVR